MLKKLHSKINNPITKYAKDLHKHSLKDEIQMINGKIAQDH